MSKKALKKKRVYKYLDIVFVFKSSLAYYYTMVHVLLSCGIETDQKVTLVLF